MGDNTNLDVPSMGKAKFMSRVSVDENGCWLWTGWVQRNGYGCFKLGGRTGEFVRAHRLSWMVWRGPIPDGLLVCHRCDVRRCVNPDHLFLGTPRDNSVDAFEKGRLKIPTPLQGEQNSFAKLTSADVAAIRTSTESSAALARRYGVDRSTVSVARRGLTWRTA